MCEQIGECTHPPPDYATISAQAKILASYTKEFEEEAPEFFEAFVQNIAHAIIYRRKKSERVT